MSKMTQIFLVVVTLFALTQAVYYRGLYESSKTTNEMLETDYRTCNRELMDYIETSKISLTNSKCITDDQRRLIRAYAERGYSVTD